VKLACRLPAFTCQKEAGKTGRQEFEMLDRIKSGVDWIIYESVRILIEFQNL
jgi:hypothetical protein